ncbi:MAG: hypothetical protein QOI48_4649, partial [Solirubrobacteraceae bacterium]|nr:hypothetical protein [Solirubrobacteraceae bacterium]
MTTRYVPEHGTPLKDPVITKRPRFPASGTPSIWSSGESAPWLSLAWTLTDTSAAGRATEGAVVT